MYIARFGGLILLSGTAVLALLSVCSAQTFSSGSTGADGDLDYSKIPGGPIFVFDPGCASNRSGA